MAYSELSLDELRAERNDLRQILRDRLKFGAIREQTDQSGEKVAWASSSISDLRSEITAIEQEIEIRLHGRSRRIGPMIGFFG